LAGYIFHLVHVVASFALVLGVLVFIHELGHYAAARWCGIHVEVFSLGFGPAIRTWMDSRGTAWKICVLPLGGYVKMHGMTMEANAEPADGTPSAYRAAEAYAEKKVGYRAIVAAAGPAANFILAIVLFAGLLMVQGRPVPLAVVDDVRADTAAAHAGLIRGDEIRSVDGVAIADFDGLRAIIKADVGRDVALGVHRGTADLTLRTHILPGPDGTGLLGVTSGAARIEPVSFGGAVIGGFTTTWDVLSQLFTGLAHIITTGTGARDLGGPIMIAHMSGQVADMGVISFVKFIALLSVNLGLVNLLPIPVLDGGHLMFYFAEWLRGRPVPPRAQEYGYRVGLALIVCVFLAVSMNDLKREGAFAWLHHLIG
jgi:regulator of sigma E protease